ncbi:MAG TPA: hypothetical protein VL096_06035, partial [Pirellulaceae bacterium]|nr:hypothetical protein [Pirellulaceae bacterium]
MFVRRTMLAIGLVGLWLSTLSLRAEEEPLFPQDINVKVPLISSDKTVRYDYDIVYVRAQRAGDEIHKRYYTDIATPVTLEPDADLMLLHPDGQEELLVAGGKQGAITDPVVSFDGQWIYYTHITDLSHSGPWQAPKGADIFKIHVQSRKIVRLTNQIFTPNTGAADWAKPPQQPLEGKTHLSYGVLNFGAYPLPGGKIIYTSNRNAYRPTNGYPQVALQLFVMDDRDTSITGDDPGENVEQIGYLNLAGALHPVTLADGRVIFSSLESQGVRGSILWGVWSIHPDGSNWNPVMSAFDPGSAPNAFHFQTQLSDGAVVIEEYYNQNNSGFGTYFKLPPAKSDGYPTFAPAYMRDAKQPPIRQGRFDNGKGRWYRMPFMPVDAVMLTPFAHSEDGPANPSILKDKSSPKVGKFTHPSGAPDNHLLTIYSPGPTNHQYTYNPQLDGGIYLLKNGQPIDEPAQLLMIKNDPRYNEQWPRAVVPYERIYGQREPQRLPTVANDGKQSPHLPEGTPYGLIGSSSLYKRESYPNGQVPQGKVTATYAGGNDPWKGLDAFTSHGNGMPLNWHNQGGDAGLYDNSDIHALRILAMEPTTDRNRGPKSGRLFASHANERLRILGEIPVRKFAGEHQPLDTDGNPDTSFLAKIPADTAFTFQTIDKRGMVLNMSQTWHQLRPGEVRTNCGGCHAHSQKPTHFELTAASKSDYKLWDLTERTPLVAPRKNDESQQKWDSATSAGLKFNTGVKSVEYFRDVQPILARSCVACHSKSSDEPAGNLVLDGDDVLEQVEGHGKLPGTYARLAYDERAQWGHKPVRYDSWGYPNASRYIRKLQSRRSLLVWKIHGERLDGFTNDDHPSERAPGERVLVHRGTEVTGNNHYYDLDFAGSVMPPPAAVKSGKVQPLTDEDRLTIVRWIDLGCPIDLDYDPRQPKRLGFGYACDDNRPTLTMTYPRANQNERLDRIVIGMADYGTGLWEQTFKVTADFEINGHAAGENLAKQFQKSSPGVWTLPLAK